MSKITKIWKIRCTKTGLFSSGGSYQTAQKVGKTWNRPGDLNNHLRNTCNDYSDYEIVEYDIIEVRAAPVSVIIGIINERIGSRSLGIRISKE